MSFLIFLSPAFSFNFPASYYNLTEFYFSLHASYYNLFTFFQISCPSFQLSSLMSVFLPFVSITLTFISTSLPFISTMHLFISALISCEIPVVALKYTSIPSADRPVSQLLCWVEGCINRWRLQLACLHNYFFFWCVRKNYVSYIRLSDAEDSWARDVNTIVSDPSKSISPFLQDLCCTFYRR